MKDKLKNKKVIGIIAVVVLVIAGFLYIDYSKAQEILAKDIQTTKQESIMIFNNSNSTTKTATSKESSLRKSYDKEAKAAALAKMEKAGKYGKYTYTNSHGKKVSCNRQHSNNSYNDHSNYNNGYSNGNNNSGYYSGGSHHNSSSSSSSGGSNQWNGWTDNGDGSWSIPVNGEIYGGNYCGNCGRQISGDICPYCSK